MRLIQTLKTAKRLAFVGVAVACLFRPGSAPAAEPRRPNIVFFLADDAGYGDFGPFGQKKIHTPTVDRLAAEGTRLLTHYAGNAVCAPSRCVLLSGLHPGHAYVRDNRDPADYALGVHEGQIPVPANHLRFPIALKNLGYVTGGYGKWGEGALDSTGSPFKQGFDHFYGYLCQGLAHNYYPKYLWDDGKQVFLNNVTLPSSGNHWGTDERNPLGYEVPGAQYSADLINEKALQFVRDHQQHPFFLYYATTLPHSMLQVPKEALDEYDGRFPEDTNAAGLGGGSVPNPRARYAAMVTHLDKGIGKVVDLIQQLGLDENTIFVFTSDNGAVPTNAGAFFNSGGKFRGWKGTMYDGGVREPAVIRWKGRIAAGASVDRTTGFEDWFPTLFDLIGAHDQIPSDIDGISFAPTLAGKTQEARPFIYREMPTAGGQQFVRVGDWKAVRNHISGLPNRDLPNLGLSGPGLSSPGLSSPGLSGPGVSTTAPTVQPARRPFRAAPPGAPDPAKLAAPGAIELYNLAIDPSEQNDVAAEHPEIVEKLAALLISQHVKSDIFTIPALDGKAYGKADETN